MNLSATLIDSLVELPLAASSVEGASLEEIAGNFGPVQAVLILFGAIFVVAPTAYFGYLVTGALVDLLIPESFGETHP